MWPQRPVITKDLLKTFTMNSKWPYLLILWVWRMTGCRVLRPLSVPPLDFSEGNTVSSMYQDEENIEGRCGRRRRRRLMNTMPSMGRTRLASMQAWMNLATWWLSYGLLTLCFFSIHLSSIGWFSMFYLLFHEDLWRIQESLLWKLNVGRRSGLW